jgi:formiminotetrahydrofolate cyclodeaminase
MVNMRDLETWLDDMCTRPLPGGVAAAAVAAAMGAALIAKALRITLRRQQLATADQATLAEVLDLALTQQATLSGLADADIQAYQACLDTRSLAAGDPRQSQARQTAIEVPIAVAEACCALLGRIPGMLVHCWHGVCVDFEIGGQLLQAGMRAGILAAQANLGAWRDSALAGQFWARLEALLEAARKSGGDSDGEELSGCDCL